MIQNMSICSELFTDAVSYFTRQKLAVFLLCLSIVTVPVRPADVELTCDETWDVGTEVSMTCTILTASYPSKCSPAPTTDIARFRIQVGAGFTERCNDSISPTCDQPRPSSPGCACYENDGTHYKLEYNFTVAMDDKGIWDCYIPCFSNFIPVLTTTSAECGKIFNHACEDKIRCKNGGTCINNSSANFNYTCICKKKYKGENCEFGPYCPDRERRLLDSLVSGLIVFGLFRLFAIVYFVFYVLYLTEYILWPFNDILARWMIVLMSVATAFFPECVVLCIIHAILWRPSCCLNCISIWWRILLVVLAIVICLVSIIYMIVARIVQLSPFAEISVDECTGKECECFHEGWQIFLFVVSCIGIAILICFVIAVLCTRPPTRRLYKLLGKCGECHKWHLFSVALDDDKLQNIFIQENLNEIFKKCANHGQEEVNLQKVVQKIQEILPQCGMDDIKNVTLHQTVCLKDHSRDKWYKQDDYPGQAVVAHAKEGTWSWSKGAGTEVAPEGLKAVLQIRLYLQRNPVEGPANSRPLPKPGPQLPPVPMERNSRVSPLPLPPKEPLPAITGSNEKHS